MRDTMNVWYEPNYCARCEHRLPFGTKARLCGACEKERQDRYERYAARLGWALLIAAGLGTVAWLWGALT